MSLSAVCGKADSQLKLCVLRCRHKCQDENLQLIPVPGSGVCCQPVKRDRSDTSVASDKCLKKSVY